MKKLFFFALLFKRSAEALQLFVVSGGCVQKLWYGKLLPLLTHWMEGVSFENLLLNVRCKKSGISQLTQKV